MRKAEVVELASCQVQDVRVMIPKAKHLRSLCAEEKYGIFGKASAGVEHQTLIWLHAYGIITHWSSITW
jgi:hypothetical protein